jgi:hypothetical protein
MYKLFYFRARPIGPWTVVEKNLQLAIRHLREDYSAAELTQCLTQTAKTWRTLRNLDTTISEVLVGHKVLDMYTYETLCNIVCKCSKLYSLYS